MRKEFLENFHGKYPCLDIPGAGKDWKWGLFSKGWDLLQGLRRNPVPNREKGKFQGILGVHGAALAGME